MKKSIKNPNAKSAPDRLMSERKRSFTKRELRSFKIKIPGLTITPQKIKKIRKKKSLDQTAFAQLLHVSPSCIRHWEQGLRFPTGPGKILLQLLEKSPGLLNYRFQHKQHRIIAGKPPSRSTEFSFQEMIVTAEQIKKIRKTTQLSQTVFAQLLNISPSCIRHWEQGLRYPTGPAKILLQLLEKSPHLLNYRFQTKRRYTPSDKPAIRRKKRGPDRRSTIDRRQVHDLNFFEQGGKERRLWKERRKQFFEKRKGWLRASPWSSVMAGIPFETGSPRNSHHTNNTAHNGNSK